MDAEPGWQRNRSDYIFYSSGPTENEIGPATFLAAGHWGATDGEMGPPMFFYSSAVAAESEIGPATFSCHLTRASELSHDLVNRVMAEMKCQRSSAPVSEYRLRQ